MTHGIFVEYLKKVEEVRAIGGRLKEMSEDAITKAQHLRRQLNPRGSTVAGLKSYFQCRNDEAVNERIEALQALAFNPINMLTLEDIAKAAWSKGRAPVCNIEYHFSGMANSNHMCIELWLLLHRMSDNQILTGTRGFRWEICLSYWRAVARMISST